MKTSKKISLWLAIVMLMGLALLSLSSCGHTSEKSWSEIIDGMEDSWNESGNFAESFHERYNVSTACLTAYSDRDFYLRYGPSPTSDCTYLSTLQEFNDEFPIECVRLLDENTVCVVYKLEMDAEGGAVPRISYVIFKREVAQLTEQDGVEKAGEYELWKKNGEVYVSSSKLTYTDFSSVGIGDPISSVLAIDPTLKIDDAFLESASQVALASETSSRLLADGILFITFQVPSAATPSLSEARITEMTFYPYTSEVTPGGGSLSLAQLSLLVASES